MSDYLIDLAKPQFWVALALAVLLVAPMSQNQHRSVLYALLNLGFIAIVAGGLAAIYILGGLVMAWLLARGARSGTARELTEEETATGQESSEPPFTTGGAGGPGTGETATGELGTSPGSIDALEPNNARTIIAETETPRSPRFPAQAICVSVAMVLTTGLFLLHKLPAISTAIHFQSVNPLLRVVAYSYICLRLVELFRAMYEERHHAPGLVSTINYLIPFHMLAAGPIQSYDDFIEQPGQPRSLTADTVLFAAQRISWGVFKKFVLAFFVQKTFLTDFQAHGIYWLVEAQMFSIWLFLDFSALSDVAVGIGMLIGVSTPENFNHPYFARNLVIFWERWHISLSMWIRRNLFFPVQIKLIRLTGGKGATACAAVGFIVSFILCGMWHGIALNFAVWGAMHAGGLIVVNLYRQFLTRRIGSKGVKAYMANPYLKATCILITFEWVVLSNVAVFYHF